MRPVNDHLNSTSSSTSPLIRSRIVIENGAEAPPQTRATGVQRRGIERVQAILDAAEELLVAHGYEATTLKAIGERAGIPTASLYHYFSDRHQVEAELVRRHLDGLRARLTDAVDEPEPRTLREAVDSVVDPYLSYFRDHPSLAQLWYADRNSTVVEMVSRFDESWAQHLWRTLIEQKLIAADTPELIVQLAFEAGNRLFDIAFQRAPDGDETTIVELRRLVTAYLATYAT